MERSAGAEQPETLYDIKGLSLSQALTGEGWSLYFTKLCKLLYLRNRMQYNDKSGTLFMFTRSLSERHLETRRHMELQEGGNKKKC